MNREHTALDNHQQLHRMCETIPVKRKLPAEREREERERRYYGGVLFGVSVNGKQIIIPSLTFSYKSHIKILPIPKRKFSKMSGGKAFWKNVGLSYLQYLNVASGAVRSGLKVSTFHSDLDLIC
jgi:hypothetical protein